MTNDKIQNPNESINIKYQKFVLLFVICILLFICHLSFDICHLYAETATIDQLPPLPEGTVLFDSEKLFGRRGKIGGFSFKPSKYGIFYDDAEKGAIKVMYLKADEKSFAGVYIILMGDLSKYSTLTFMIKGQKGGEAFEIGLNDTISNKREDAVMVGSIYRYLAAGLTTDWQKAVVPLEDFFGSNMQKVYSIIFHFNEIGKGAFWVDDIQFHTGHLFNLEDVIYKQGYLLLDDFDHNDMNLLGRKANTYKKLPSVCEAQRTDAVCMGNKGRSLKLIFNKESTGWCGYFTLLNQIDGEYFDLSKYKSVSFMIKGENGGETFQLGMADKNWINIGDSLKAGQIEDFLTDGVTTEWKEVVVPLAKFGSLDLTQMGSFVIDFNKKQKGIVYIDDLKFILKTKEELLAEW